MVRGALGFVLGALLHSASWVCSTAPVGAWEPLRGFPAAASLRAPRQVGAPATESRSADPRRSRGSGNHAARSSGRDCQHLRRPRAHSQPAMSPHSPVVRPCHSPTITRRGHARGWNSIASVSKSRGGFGAYRDVPLGATHPRRRQRLPGRASSQRLSVAGARMSRGAPMPAAAEKPRRG